MDKAERNVWFFDNRPRMIIKFEHIGNDAQVFGLLDCFDPGTTTQLSC